MAAELRKALDVWCVSNEIGMVSYIILALKNMNSKAAKETAGEDGDDE